MDVANVFVVYALYNKERNKIYIGQSRDIHTRLKRHNGELPNRKNSYTRLNSGNWVIIYKEGRITRHEAIKREKQLKTQKGREFIWNIVKNKNGGMCRTA